jgi:hypothetical protein
MIWQRIDIMIELCRDYFEENAENETKRASERVGARNRKKC